MDQANKTALSLFINKHGLQSVLGAIRDIAIMNADQFESIAQEMREVRQTANQWRRMAKRLEEVAAFNASFGVGSDCK